MTSEESYYHTRKNYNKLGFDLNYYQEIACKEPHYAYMFARFIPGANIEYCQKYACKIPQFAYYFAQDILGADIEYCRNACELDESWINEFNKMIINKAMV